MKPKFQISKSKVLRQFEKVRNLCDIVSYSSKTNPIVTKILETEVDCMFSVHTLNELKNIKDFSRVLFFAQAWNEDDLRDMLLRGIKWFVVDNLKDLEVLEKLLSSQKNDFIVNLLLRIKLRENTLRTEKYFVFGMDSDFVNKKISELRKNRFIHKLGVHFHRKTQNIAEWNLKNEFEEIISLENFSLIDLVNIGGGLPSEYANTNISVLNSIFEKINEFREFLKNKNINLMIEPGRFIAAPAGKLVTEIIGLYENNIIVNASVYQGDLDALIVPVKLLVEGELGPENKDAKPYVIKGLTPCSMDLFRYKVYLKNPRIGNKLIFLNAGAYNFFSDFCDLDKIESEIVD